MDQFCTAGDIERIIPEVQADAEFEQIESGIMTEYIKEGTILLKAAIRARYPLDQFASPPSALPPPEGLPGMVRRYCALITAAIIMKTRQLAEGRDEQILEQKRFYAALATGGNLLDNEGESLLTINGPVTDLAPLSTELEPIYSEEKRRGVPDMLPITEPLRDV